MHYTAWETVWYLIGVILFNVGMFQTPEQFSFLIPIFSGLLLMLLNCKK